MPESCQQKTPASGCPLDTPSLPFPSGRYSALSLLPAKGTIQPNIASQIRYMFQSTHPRGVRPYVQHFSSRGERFQSTHPRGVRPFLKDEYFKDQPLFQSTHPRGVRLYSEGMNANREQCFNPRTREGCDSNLAVSEQVWVNVSIHAPARGATAPLPSPLNRAFERQNARTSAFWAFFHAVFLKQTVFSLFFSQLPLRGFHWETSVSLRFPFFRFCSFLLSRGAVFQNTSGPSGSMAVLAPTCSSRFFQLAPRK